MKKYNIIAWDFNGTILDDIQIGIESINVLLERRGLRSIVTKEEYQSSFFFPIIEWYRSLGFDFEREDYTVVAREWVKEYTMRESRAGLCDGVTDLLGAFAEMGKRQIIISASEKNMLKRQLSALGIEKYFEEIVGKDDVYANGKTEAAKNWRKYNPGELLFIGDTDHDLEVAEAIGADCILVAAGHQSYERLRLLHKNKINSLRVVKGSKDILNID